MRENTKLTQKLMDLRIQQAASQPDDSQIPRLQRRIQQLQSELHDTKLKLEESSLREKEFDFTERTLREQNRQLSTRSPTTSPNVEEIEKRHRETILELKKEHSLQIKKVQESMQGNYDYLLQSIPTPPQPTWQCPGRHCPGCPGCTTSTDNVPRAPEETNEEPPWQYGED